MLEQNQKGNFKNNLNFKMSVPLILVDIIIQLNFWVWFFVGFAIDAKFSCKQTVGVILKHKNQVLIQLVCQSAVNLKLTTICN